jgi:hypothetical protein
MARRSFAQTVSSPDRHELTYEKKKLQGKFPGANGGSVQRLAGGILQPKAQTECNETNRDSRQ